MLLNPIRYLVWFLGRVALALRYRVTVAGRDAVRAYPAPYLFLPNHPAYADPPNVLAQLWRAFRPRPMLLETNFQNPVLGPIGWLMNAIKVPDLTSASAEARQRAEGAVATAVAALKQGDNVILWPSGRLTRDGAEHLGGTRAVADILAAMPAVTVVLVRTRGLWGSGFSWAHGTPPSIPRGLGRGVGVVLANLVALTPRRRVTLTLEAFPPAARPASTREDINPWLEAWYNADVKPEPPTYVPYHFAFGPRTYRYPPPKVANDLDLTGVTAETKAAVADLLAERLHRPLTAAELAPERTFLDLGIDSLDSMELTLAIEQRFGFAGSRMPTSVGELWALAEGRLAAAPVEPAPAAWFAPPTGPPELVILGETVGAAFLNRVRANPTDVALCDDLAGVLTYRRLLLAATVLADRFDRIQDTHVGLMLPASVAGMTSLLALHLAGKVPVLLNWTTGPANMAHAVTLLGVSRVITSRRFVDRAQVTVPGVSLYFLEDVRATLTRGEKLHRLLDVTLFRGRTVRRLLATLDPDPHAQAVVLFTSGSEKAPKAVPLTHANVIADLRSSIPLLGLDRRHSGLVFLPLFHSFGHTVTGLLPVLSGFKAVFHPDPTDAGGLVQKCSAYKTTATAATPTFLGYLFDKAAPGDLDSLDVIVVGAEKCPPALFERAKKFAPNGRLMEGYGITECSPVVSVNPYHQIKQGTIGRALVDVHLAVRDLETDELLPSGRMGMLHVSGANVFGGYVGGDDSPFRDFDGRRWYVTGDLAELDADGYIVFHGRLKRFLKAGGEMISLPALEEPFARRYPPTEDGPRVAVEGVETPAGRRVVLFTVEDLTVQAANAILQDDGFRGVMRLDEVRRVDKVPVLGSGKTDYKVLRKMVEGG